LDSDFLNDEIQNKELNISKENTKFQNVDCDLIDALSICLDRETVNGKPVRDLGKIGFGNWWEIGGLNFIGYFTADALDFYKKLRKFYKENKNSYKNDVAK